MCLFRGETHAILALSGNINFVELSLIAMSNVLFKNFANSFVSFDGILPILADFLLYFLKIVPHHKQKQLEDGCLQV